MSAARSPTLALRARGPLACFTRPELKAERVSYPVMTPSAARGLIEAVLWKPAVRWHIDRIGVLNPIRFISFRRNEVNTKASDPPRAVVDGGGDAGNVTCYFADEDRAQRNTVALREVDYLVEAHLTMTEDAGPDDNMTKFVAMFRRRVREGQHFHQPYFGCREFVAEVLPPDDAPDPIPESRDLGIMLWDIAYGEERNRPIFFRAELREGVLHVPADPEETLTPPETGQGEVT